MSEQSGAGRRRRRRRSPSETAGSPLDPAPTTDAAPEAAPSEPTTSSSGTSRAERKPRRSRRDTDPGERGLRDLVGAGRSQLGVSGALRGRDVNRPTDEDIVQAEQSLVIVRRHWKPSEPK